jgi:hypothetical protein
VALTNRQDINIVPGSLIRTSGPSVLGHDVFSNPWYNRTCIYLGPSIIDRDDGVRIINHLLLVDGEERLVDRRILSGAVVL